MLSLMYHRSTSVTGRNLARLLGLQPRRTYHNGDIVVVRWGNSAHADMTYAINTSESIRTAANSIRSLTAMYTAGVPTLEFYTEAPQDESLYPILGRRLYHRAGLDIVWLYRQQFTIERLFDYLKNPDLIRIMPMFHFKDDSIRGHIFTCVLGLMLLTLLQREIRQKYPDMALRQIIDLLSQIKLTEIRSLFKNNLFSHNINSSYS